MRALAGRTHEPRGQRLREALETLGPIYVKFAGAFHAARLLPVDIADELAKLQDQVPAFLPSSRWPKWSASPAAPSTNSLPNST